MALGSESHVAIGIPGEAASKVAVRTTFCSIPNIVVVEPLDLDKPAGGNGTSKPKKRPGR
jgi:hypothetical protein